MILDFVSVTDHIENFSIEKEILGDFFAENLSNKTTIISLPALLLSPRHKILTLQTKSTIKTHQRH